mmetsp:Transcript_24773/g.51475  ORF Transcript_24773/g.51475 Transcript_24773/m.51475 type:complete len:90 (+) Transcript_24773:290-559(+)
MPHLIKDRLTRSSKVHVSAAAGGWKKWNYDAGLGDPVRAPKVCCTWASASDQQHHQRWCKDTAAAQRCRRWAVRRRQLPQCTAASAFPH